MTFRGGRGVCGENKVTEIDREIWLGLFSTTTTTTTTC